MYHKLFFFLNYEKMHSDEDRIEEAEKNTTLLTCTGFNYIHIGVIPFYPPPPPHSINHDPAIVVDDEALTE